MKKTFTLVCLMLQISLVQAQDSPTSNQQLRLSASSTFLVENQSPNPSTNSPAMAAAGDTIWYDDFSDASLANWTLATTGIGADSLWEQTTTGPYGTFTGTFGDIESPTASNGWVMFDSDGNGSANPNTGAPTGVEFDTYIQMAAPVDLSAFSQVAVTFHEYYVALVSQTYIEVSTNGTDWTTIEIHGSFNPNEATAEDEIVYQDISGVAGGQPTVWIRLRYEGFGYFWQVDDFMLIEGSTYDLNLTDVFNGNIVDDWEYTRIPLAQAEEVEIGAIAVNGASEVMTGVVYSFDIIKDDTDTVATGSFDAASDSIVGLESDTTWHLTGFTPTEIGVYEVIISVQGDSLDENPANNSGSAVFAITDFIFAHDGAVNQYSVISGTEDDVFRYGLFYDINSTATVYSVQTAFNLVTPDGATSCIAQIFDMTVDDLESPNPFYQDIFDLEPSDFSANSISTTELVINDGNGVVLEEGKTYFVAVGNTAPGDPLELFGSQGNADFATRGYGPLAGGGVGWFGGGVSLAPLIRLNFDQTVDISEEVQTISKVSVYPNPSVDNLTVEFSSEENQDVSVNIYGINGALLMSRQLKSQAGQANKIAFDVSNLSSGMYLVQIQGAQSSLSRRVVVQ